MNAPDAVSTEPTLTVEPRDAFCTRCGVSPEAGDHSTCQRWLASEEPPRFCAQCGRRMKVQIIPTGWAAQCSRHGEISGGAGV